MRPGPAEAADAPPCAIREISDTHAIPERYLVQILLQLKGAGLVVSTRGASGGYRLARPAAKLALSEVLAVIDGPDTPQPRFCPRETSGRAILGVVWDRVRRSGAQRPRHHHHRRARRANLASRMDHRSGFPASLLSGMQRKNPTEKVSLVRVAGLAESQENAVFCPVPGGCQTFPGRNGRVDLVLWWEGA